MRHVRSIRLGAVLSVGLLTLSACGSSTTSSPAAPVAPAATAAPADSGGSADAAAPDTGSTGAPVVASADGCSTDGSPTGTDASDGDLPTIEVNAESAESPLPDLAVRRINCDGGVVNLKNELPSALPLLVWFWAPH